MISYEYATETPEERRELASHLRTTFQGRLPLWIFRGLADAMSISEYGKINAVGTWTISWRRINGALEYEWHYCGGSGTVSI